MRLTSMLARTTALGVGIVLSNSIVPAVASFNSATPPSAPSATFGQLTSGTTTITITPEPVESSGKRFGINLGEQTFYGSGQLLKNLVFRNPGFEGLEYRSILHCQNARGHACEDSNSGATWTGDFWSGADFRFLSGKNQGKTGKLAGFDVHPTRLLFPADTYPGTGDYVLLVKAFPGDPTAGWWPTVQGGAAFSPEFHDLSPHSAGKQALKVAAEQPGASARLNSYFDSYADGHPNEAPRSFLRLHGRYELRFRAKCLSGTPQISVQVDRSGSKPFLQKAFTLSKAWQDYTVPFDAEDDAANTHALELQFGITGSTLLLDDVSLTAASDESGNPTAFRGPVVRALQEFHPGVLRLMASNAQLGSSVANLLAPIDARVRSGYSVWNQRQEDVPIGIPEFLQLCAVLGAEPWITLPTSTTPADATMLVRYFTTPQSGGKAWTQQFSRIHLELGNETWNSVFSGETMEDAAGYGQHADAVFRAIRSAPGFQAAHFDLVIGGQADWPERNQAILAAAGSSYDSLAVAPYLWRKVNDAPSDDALFGPLMAEPELLDKYGQVRQIQTFAHDARHPALLTVYEVNLHSTEGTASQSTLDRTTPSLAGGLAVAVHMLQMRRDNGVQTQMLFNLPEFTNQRQDGKSIRLWGSIVDLGPTQRRRPTFEALALANQIAGGRMLRTLQGGSDPTWSAGGPGTTFSTGGPKLIHAIQSFAFDLPDSKERGVLLFNLGSKPQNIQILGLPKATQAIENESVTGSNPAANNEDALHVVRSRASSTIGPGGKLTLAPYEMSCVRWRVD